VGFGAVFRISFTLFVWFLLHACLLLAKSCQKVDSSYWCVKILLFIGLLVVSWFIPDQFFDVYVQIARVISGIFLLLQIVILIDFAYSWNEDWISEEKNWKGPILASAIFFFSGALVWIIFMFQLFGGSSCGLENAFMSITIVSTLIYTLISVFFAEKGGLLPPAVVCLYTHYLCFSSLSSDPSSSCNSLSSGNQVHLIISLVIAACSITYASWNVANSNSLFSSNQDNEEEPTRSSKDVEKQLSEKASSGAAGDGTVPKEEDPEIASEEAIQYSTRNAKFHAVMAAASMYMAMVLTNWSSLEDADSASGSYDVGRESMWIKITSQWVTIILYIWSLIAPTVCKDREFV